MRLKLTLAYDGTGFRGWAAQPGLRTVEASLREALDAIFPAWSGLVVAGRTDRGVHALANVASVDVEGGPRLERVAEALNTALPDDVAVVSAEEAAPDFNARFSARRRTYRYRVWRSRVRSPFETRRSWWYPRPLDVARMQDQATLLIGEHDFTAFTRTETEHKVFTRVVQDARWLEHDDVLAFEITADSFLRHMVRTIVGTMVDGVDLAPLLDGRARDEAGQTAPSCGLYLARVAYD
ncbi:MAG TPA: tRNA pseudouridine(38-40) synthase TruA [Gaiellaceae bacterium]|nr:tRNA pseudouridine(38-40) synthase TruA [Gaiellaceae bacterium]